MSRGQPLERRLSSQVSYACQSRHLIINVPDWGLVTRTWVLGFSPAPSNHLPCNLTWGTTSFLKWSPVSWTLSFLGFESVDGFMTFLHGTTNFAICARTKQHYHVAIWTTGPDEWDIFLVHHLALLKWFVRTFSYFVPQGFYGCPYVPEDNLPW